ncbi:MAG: tetratricopeptide repeat protein [Polyangiales bacterium]
MPRPAHAATTLTLAALAWARAASAQADYDAAMDLAARRERAGHAREAAASLDALQARYPQDFALALRLGWLWSQSGEHGAARARYARALSLSGDASRDARLGLAWSLLGLGDSSRARREFERLVSSDPRDASARAGLALAVASTPRPLRLWTSLWLGAQTYAGHPTRSWSVSATASVTAQVLDALLLGVTYRAIDYAVVSSGAASVPAPRPGLPPPPPGTSQSRASTSVQHEVHLVAGVARPRWALRAHLGFVYDGANALAPATVVGVSGRLALRGELNLELSDTIYQDRAVLRAVGAWGASLGRGWSLGPVASMQHQDGAFGGAVGLVLGRSWGGAQVGLSARYGDERRPTSLSEALTFATDDRVRGALTLSGLVPLGRGLSLSLRYDGLMLTTSASAGDVDASAHFFTAGILGAW